MFLREVCVIFVRP